MTAASSESQGEPPGEHGDPPAPAGAQIIKKRLPSRFQLLRERIADRLARSSRVFLLGVLVACGIEVLVDWNATLFEINVLRDGMRQRGQNYARILANAAVEPMLSYDAVALDQLADGLFHDADVVFVRFTDDQGTVLLDRMLPDYAARFHKKRRTAFRDYYASQLRRDVGGILSDPEGLAQRMAGSRHRDFVQAWNDLVMRLSARFTPPPPLLPQKGPLVLYQDRLKKQGGGHDPDVTYALCTITDERSEELGVVVVAFSMDGVNAAILKKYLKGLGILVFFLGLILTQNLLSRRDKLRLLDLEARQRFIKQALREALPAGSGDLVSLGPLTVAAGLSQADGPVDGVVWDVLGPPGGDPSGDALLLVVDPEGEGVSAAATALYVLRTFRDRQNRREPGTPLDLLAEAAALGEAALTMPLARPIGLWLSRLELGTGALTGISTRLGAARVLGRPEGRKRPGPAPLPLREEPLLDLDQTPAGLLGPLVRFTGELPAGGVLCGLYAGIGQRRDRRDRDADAVAAYTGRARRGAQDLGTLATDATSWARGRIAHIGKGDVLVLLVARSEPAAPS